MINISINRLIYFLYIFFLPFSGLINISIIPATIRTYMFSQSSNYFLFLGLLIYLLSNQLVIKKYQDLKQLASLYGYTVVHSLILALILYFPLGTLYGETTIRAVSGNIIFYFIVVLNIYYNYVMLTQYVKIAELLQIFDIQVLILLFVGYIQFLAIWIGGIFANIYNLMASIMNLLPIDKLNRGVCFFGTEPSSATILSYIVIPYLLARILTNTSGRIKYILRLVLFVPLILSSTSSSLLITMGLLIIAFVCLATGRKSVYRIVAFTAFICGAFIAISYGLDSFSQTTYDKNSFAYLVLGKIVDRTNMSTMTRSSTIINDMKIFFEFPFLGVGNGIQGYFYNANMPDWVKVSYEVKEWMSGTNGIINGGGSFFCTYLSSYGIVGCLAAIPIIKKYSVCLKNMEEINAIAYKIFSLFLIMFLASCWFSMGIRDANVSFLLTLPLVYGGIKSRKLKNSIMKK